MPAAKNATERVVVLMTPKQKAEVRRRAKVERLSLSGFMRRQALGCEEIPSFLVTQLRESTAVATEALDHAIDRLADAQSHQSDREAQARARARAEFAVVDPEAFATLIASKPQPTDGQPSK